MIVSVAGCVLNAALDYALVAGLGLGVFGSAVGSLSVQVLTALVMAGYFFSRASGLSFTRFAFDGALNKEIMFNGSSEFIGEMASAISMFAFNFVLMKYAGPEGVAAFSVLGYVVYGFSMICIGFGQGLTPLVSFLFGAKEFETAIELRKITNKILFGIGAVISVFFLLMGRSYAGLFGCSDSVVDMVVTGFRFYLATFLFMGYDVINSMYFTSCGDAKSSALISSLRGIVLLLAFTFILPMIFGMTGIWMAGPSTEILTSIVSFCLINRQRLALEKGQTAWKPEKALQ
jgi:Na+-driven multidrug efflux pump